MRVHIASDHAGFDLKNILADHLRGQGHVVVDHGADRYDANDDYPSFCIAAAEAVVAEPGSLGVVLGGSGNGEQIAANKVRGVRAALAWSVETARLGRQHNDANVLVLGGRTIGPEVAKDCLVLFLETPFEGGRHARRVAKLAECGER